MPGIEVYMPAPVVEAVKAEVVDFKCPQCGATTAYSAADGGLTCTHCNYYEAPQRPIEGKGAEQLEFTVDTLEQAAVQDQLLRPAQGWGESRVEVACQSCGAVITLATTNLSYTCPFCGSNKVIQRQASQDVLRPRFVIPFKVDTPACSRISTEWLGSSWMTPSDLRQSASKALFQGVYLPYWTFDARTPASWRAEVGHPRMERYRHNGEWKTRTVIDWRWESGQVEQIHDDLLVPGAGSASPLLLKEIGNFDLNDLSPYEPKYLAGFQAQAYDVPLEAAWETGRQEMRERTKQACIARASTSQVRNFTMSLDFADESWRYILLPVYSAAYTYGGKTYQAMINGQTGAIAGQRPVDWNKLWLVIALALLPGFIVGVLGLLAIPLFGIGVPIAGIGFFLLLVGVVASIVLYIQAARMDDI